MHTAIGTLQNVHADAHASIRLPRTMLQPPTHLQQPRWLHQRRHPSLPPVGTGTDPQALAGEYLACFDACQPAADQLSPIAWFGDNVVKSRGMYATLGPVLAFPGILLAYSTAWNPASTSARICTTAIRSWRAP